MSRKKTPTTGHQLRVLHVLGELRASGAETMLVSAAPLFRSHGVVADVLSTGRVPGVYAQRFEAAGYRVLHLPFRRHPGFFVEERRLMAAGNYDVIHLHTEEANFWHGLVASSVRPAVVLRTIHNSFAFEGNLRWRRGLQRRQLHRMGIKHVAISDSVQQTETKRYQLPTELVWNWYDSSRFVPTTAAARAVARTMHDIPADAFVIASIGNCSKVKNHTAVIEAIASLPEARRPIYLHAGMEETHQPERELARSLGIASQIRFLGSLDDVLPMLQASDAFVMPSLYEGFGIAAIEALATGLPALFAEVDGLRDFKADFPGLIYTGTDAASVCDGLLQLMNMPEQDRACIAALFPQMARRRFGMERGVQEYITLYRQGAPMPALGALAPLHAGTGHSKAP